MRIQNDFHRMTTGEQELEMFMALVLALALASMAYFAMPYYGPMLPFGSAFIAFWPLLHKLDSWYCARLCRKHRVNYLVTE